MENILLSLTSQILIELRRIAKAKGITRSELLRRIIEDYLKAKVAPSEDPTDLLEPLKDILLKNSKYTSNKLEKILEELTNLRGKLLEDKSAPSYDFSKGERGKYTKSEASESKEELPF